MTLPLLKPKLIMDASLSSVRLTRTRLELTTLMTVHSMPWMGSPKRSVTNRASSDGGNPYKSMFTQYDGAPMVL